MRHCRPIATATSGSAVRSGWIGWEKTAGAWRASATKAGARAIRSIYEDRDGNLWLGSMVDGATRLWDGWTTRLGRAQGLSAALLWSIARGPDGAIWVGGSDGVDVYRNGRFRSRVAGRSCRTRRPTACWWNTTGPGSAPAPAWPCCGRGTWKRRRCWRR
ncbi:hypothetical protein H1235_04585 [Pseudoxanthomonas sp. NC8]|nr:hypothetical protein H1235_04585 [Pseudoxanthomonas sp. NC8]